MQITINSLLAITGSMSLILFAVMGMDKAFAKRGAWRIPEKTLFLLALFGGALGGIAGMYFFRHKTKHASFKFGMPLLLIINVIACVYLIIK